MHKIYSKLITLVFLASLSLLSFHASAQGVSSLIQGAKAKLKRGQLSSALSSAQIAKSQAITNNNAQLIWETQNLIGEIYLTQKDYQKAIDLFISLSLKAQKSNNYSVSANGYLSLANIYSSMGAVQKAKETYAKAYEQFDKIDYEMGMIEVRSASGYNNIAGGDLIDALKDFNMLLSLAKKDSIPYFQLIAYDGLLDAYQKLNEFDKGKEIGESYLALISQEGGSDHMAITAHNKLALIYLHEGENEECIKALQWAEAIQESNRSFDQGLAETLGTYVKVYEAMDQQEEADGYRVRLAQLKRNMKEEPILSEEEIQVAEVLATEFENTSIAFFEDEDRTFEQEASERRQNSALDDKRRLDQLEHETLIGTRTFRHSALEAEYIHQDLMVAQHEFESTERQVEILLYKEQLEMHKLELKVAEEEKLILEQKAQIHKKQRMLYVIIAIAVLIIGVFFGIEYFRIKKLSKLLSDQQGIIHQRNLELEESNATIMGKNAKLHRAHDEIKSKNEALKQSQASLVQAEKLSALGLLTAGIAHEINNPIGFVKSGLEVMGEQAQDMIAVLEVYEHAIKTQDMTKVMETYLNAKDQGHDIESIKKDIEDLIRDTKYGTGRIVEIVDGLRVFSRKDEKDFTKGNLVEIMESALLISKSKYKGRVEIKRLFSENIPDIDCFPGQINQIFINLIGNAADAIEGYGWIKIHLQNLDSKHVRIIIQDNGSGMPEEVRRKIFEPLFTTKESGKGTGLGLSITTDIIKTHGAHIEVRSKEGKGTAFIITMLKNIERS